MKYRKMPKCDDDLSVLGFGCMRFPTDKDGGIIAEPSFAMLHQAYMSGVNYFDTAWIYHKSQSESFLGSFLKQIDRNKVYVATKLPCWEITSRKQMDEVLDQQLKRLQTDRIDYYLLHALNKKSWKEMNMLGVTDFLTKARENGKIRYAGFSFHDDYGTFNRIIHAYDWEFCQIMLNFLDTTYQAGLRGMRLAASRGIGVISMEPLRGGKLVSSIPNDVIDIWRNDPANLDPVKRALRWVWNNPECTLLISGMSTMEHVLQNTQEASVATANSLVPSQLRKYQMARKVYLRKLPFLCSECRYCMPCPNEVAIPTVLGMFCEAVMFGDKERHQREYQSFIPEANRADKCTGCNICTEKCPQKINIPHWMKEISHFYT